MKVIDFHNHFYPPDYLVAVERGPSNLKVTHDDEGNPVLHYLGDYNVVVPGHRDIAFRDEVMERTGITRQVLSFTAPGTLIETQEQSVRFARMVNDGFASIMQGGNDRFTALATLPLNDPAASVVELERAMTELGFRGAMLLANADGVPLSDRRFWPLYERASQLEAVFYIHPTKAPGVEAMTEYWLLPLVGFTFDTTLAAAGLVFSGAVEQFPGIKWVLAHLGGAIPYLAERLDRGYEAFPECREHIGKKPSSYLQDFYYDTVNFDPKALRLAMEFAGADHLLAGSDYPHRIGSLQKMVDSIQALDLSARDQNAILWDNTNRLLKLE
jgi:aminocarboxymuconate-semialdehyde decarboxylase